MKNGAPASEVIIPTGISELGSMLLAKVSAQRVKNPPARIA